MSMSSASRTDPSPTPARKTKTAIVFTTVSAICPQVISLSLEHMPNHYHTPGR